MTPSSPALWSCLPDLPLAWDRLPEHGVTLPDGTALRCTHAPDGTGYLTVTLHESESFEELYDGRGAYTEEEHDDPDTVVEARWTEAQRVMDARVAEATAVLGPPSADPASSLYLNWPLPGRTVSVGLFQADRECPVEVCVCLLPPGQTPGGLGL
ncbi:hypothetical protein [Deinococcus sonorensis]|uniref:Uncharacterized protein n=2 Tax=Deinococcus sonorensis TaxID=309891 RepID=A0AAU7UHQ3_9DEIO